MPVFTDRLSSRSLRYLTIDQWDSLQEVIEKQGRLQNQRKAFKCIVSDVHNTIYSMCLLRFVIRKYEASKILVYIYEVWHFLAYLLPMDENCSRPKDMIESQGGLTTAVKKTRRRNLKKSCRVRVSSCCDKSARLENGSYNRTYSKHWTQ